MAGDYDLDGAWLTLPAGIQATKRHGVDFDLFSFVDKKERLLLFVYIGMHPSFPSDEAPKKYAVTQGKLNGMKIRNATWQDSQKRRHREALVQLDKSLVAHCMYTAASTADVRQSDALLATLRKQRQDKMRP